MWGSTPVVVTGGAGFIGSHLCEALAGLGAKVRVHDNLSRGDYHNIMHLTKCGATTLRDEDLRGEIPIWPRGAIVFHLAARVTSIRGNSRDQLGMMQDNLRINANVIEACRVWKPELLVLVSTVCVYPADAPVPCVETDAWPLHPEETNEGYGLAKGILEKQGEFLYREAGIPVLVARFSNAIGTRDYYDDTAHVVPALIRRVLEGEDPLTVWSTGNQTRVFVDARELACALIRLAEMPAAHDARPVNIGHEHEISIRELAGLVAQACDRPKLPILFDDSYPDGHARRAVDNTRLRSLIGWVPDTPLEQTIAEMVEDYRARLHAHV